MAPPLNWSRQYMNMLGFSHESYPVGKQGMAAQFHNSNTGQSFTFYFYTWHKFVSWMFNDSIKPDRITRHFHKEIPSRRPKTRREKKTINLAPDFGRLIDI